MKRLRPATIPRSAIGSMLDQEFRNRPPKCRGSHVESGVARVEVMSDVGEEERSGFLTPRTHL
jgi:hypothetical protein